MSDSESGSYVSAVGFVREGEIVGIDKSPYDGCILRRTVEVEM